MDDTPISATDAKNLRFLRVLVTVLTITMILGLLTIVMLFVIRFSGERTVIQVPDQIVVPDGVRVTAFTRGRDWYAVVTDGNEILIYDAESGELRQQIKISD